jgi:hypothetical protein
MSISLRTISALIKECLPASKIDFATRASSPSIAIISQEQFHIASQRKGITLDRLIAPVHDDEIARQGVRYSVDKEGGMILFVQRKLPINLWKVWSGQLVKTSGQGNPYQTWMRLAESNEPLPEVEN